VHADEHLGPSGIAVNGFDERERLLVIRPNLPLTHVSFSGWIVMESIPSSSEHWNRWLLKKPRGVR
jgi:hypothetical protein